MKNSTGGTTENMSRQKKQSANLMICPMRSASLKNRKNKELRKMNRASETCRTSLGTPTYM